MEYGKLQTEYNKYMGEYNLRDAIAVLFKLVQILNNGYIKLGRSYLKGRDGESESFECPAERWPAFRISLVAIVVTVFCRAGLPAKIAAICRDAASVYACA